MSVARGRFISVEGIDGAGKSTHIEWLANWVKARGHEVILTREPGGTPLGESLRTLLLHESMDPGTEALLMFAARHENLKQRILPALESGIWVVCDRFTDATFAYQGAGKGIPDARLQVLENWVQGALQPDLTFLFDLPPASAQSRLEATRLRDKFESESTSFFDRTRAGYLVRAAGAPERFRVVDGSGSIEQVRLQLEKHLLSLCL